MIFMTGGIRGDGVERLVVTTTPTKLQRMNLRPMVFAHAIPTPNHMLEG
jgi:hypothetical protein